jgi:hypothetical protein
MFRSLWFGMAVAVFLSPAIASAQAGATSCHATLQESHKQVPWAGNAGEIQWSADQPDCKVDTGALGWITISVAPPGSNASQRVLRYSVDTNFSTAKREGKVRIGDTAVTIEQAGGPPPGMAYSPGRLEFKFTLGKDSGWEITKPLYVGSEEPLAFSAKPDAAATWVTVKPDKPEDTPHKQRTFQVTVTAEGKGPGVYRSSIQIEAPGAANAKERVPVTLTVEKAK